MISTTYYRAGKRLSAKAFSKPVLFEDHRLYELVLESKDGALAKEIRAGASPNGVVDCAPFFMHALAGTDGEVGPSHGRSPGEPGYLPALG